jgi:hypothetical protein
MRAIESIGQGRFGSGISYNMVVMPSGRIFEGQPVGRRGTHTGSYTGNCTESGCPNRGKSVTSANHNVTARAVVIAQNVGDPVSSAQVHSIAKIAAAWKRAGTIVSRTAPWHGHRCVSTKSCPGDKGWAWMSELVRLTEYYTVNGLNEGEEDDMTVEELMNHRIKTGQGEFAVATLLANAALVPLIYNFTNEVEPILKSELPKILAAASAATGVTLTQAQVEVLAALTGAKLAEVLPVPRVGLDVTVEGESV